MVFFNIETQHAEAGHVADKRVVKHVEAGVTAKFADASSLKLRLLRDWIPWPNLHITVKLDTPKRAF